jgi:hypothetical protein
VQHVVDTVAQAVPAPLRSWAATLRRFVTGAAAR